MASKSGALHRLLAIGRRADPQFDRRMIRLALLSLMAAAIEIAALGSLLPLLALVAQGDTRSQWIFGLAGQEPLILVLLFAALVLGAALIRLTLAAAIQRGVLQVGHSINVAIQRRLLHQPYSFHASTNSSRFVSALQKTEQLATGVLGPLIQGVAGLAIGTAILAFLLATIDWRITVAAGALLGGTYLLLSRYAASRLVQRGGVTVEAHQDQVRLLMESSGAIRDILLDHRQASFAEAFERASLRMKRSRAGTDFLNFAPRFLVEAIGAIAIAALAVMIAVRDGSISGSLPMFGLLALAMIRIVPLAQTAYRGWTMLAAHQRAIDDVDDLMRLPLSSASEPVPEPLPFRNRLSAKNLSFAYPGSHGAVLRYASFSIDRGEWLGICGPTGIGKSTIGDLVMGLLEPDSGTLAIDDVPLTEALLGAWQRSVAHVSQSVYLLDESVAANIALAPKGAEMDRNRVSQCAQIAQLESWIADLPEGLDSIVGERGRRLSGGQRQRIGIARALYKEAPLLLLDEATNALDPATEAALLDGIRRALPDITVLMISHRSAALERCDRVLRVEDRRLIPA